MRILDFAETKRSILNSGRTIEGYCRTKERWSCSSLKRYFRGEIQMKPGSRAYLKYVPELVADGFAVFKGE